MDLDSEILQETCPSIVVVAAIKQVGQDHEVVNYMAEYGDGEGIRFIDEFVRRARPLLKPGATLYRAVIKVPVDTVLTRGWIDPLVLPRRHVMESKLFVYCVGIEWQNNTGGTVDLFRDEFYGFAEDAGQAAEHALLACRDGAATAGHPKPDRETSRIVSVRELGKALFRNTK